MTNKQDENRPFILSIPESEIPEWMKEMQKNATLRDWQSAISSDDAIDLSQQVIKSLAKAQKKRIRIKVVDSREPVDVTTKRSQKIFRYRGTIHSFTLAKALEHIAPIVYSPLPILIEGETGTGKEVLARSIHDASGLRGSFVVVDCGNIPSKLIESELFGHIRGAFTGADKDKRGLIDAARDGTVLLDEIENISMDFQGKLLRFLRDGTYRRVGSTETTRIFVRMISASNKSIDDMVKNATLRRDLFYRIAGDRISLPSLRSQPEAIGPTFEDFVQEYSMRTKKKISIHPSAHAALLLHDWPGNFGELRHVAENAATRAGESDCEIDFELLRSILKPAFPKDLDSGDFPTMDAITRQHIEKALAYTKGNVLAASRLLDMAESSVRKATADLKIDISRFRRINRIGRTSESQ